MSNKKKITMTIRPGKKYPELIEKLEKLAGQHNRSLNGFILIHLDNIIKNGSTNI